VVHDQTVVFSACASSAAQASQNVAPSPLDQYNAGCSPLTIAAETKTCRMF
jgi:hypothetical protein